MFREENIHRNILDGITLEDHQMEGLRACLSHEIGIMFMTTGSGKTELMCAIAYLMNCPTMIVAEETVVLDQIKKRLELRKVVEEAGLFYAGRKPNDSLVCVGSIASLIAPTKISRKNKESQEKFECRLRAFRTRCTTSKEYRALAEKCELIMIDEADKATSNQYRKLLQRYTKSRYLYGFTGTMPDKKEDPVEHLVLKEHLGNIIARTNRKDLEKAGRIIPVKYVMKAFGAEGSTKNAAAFDIAQKKWINENQEFHNLVRDITHGLPDDNFLILVESIELGKRLEKAIEESQFICGKTPNKLRNKVISEFENKQRRVLIGSRILKRGLDLRGGIDNLIICASNKKYSDLEQKIGRALRVNSKGRARIFDFMFLCNRLLYKHSRKRLKRMVELGYQTQVVMPKGILDGSRVIKRGFNLLKYV